MSVPETHDPGGIEQTDDRDPPANLSELLDLQLRPDDLAVELHGDKWFYVLERTQTPAGSYPVQEGGTLAEWLHCRADAPVLVVVNIDEAFDTVGVSDLDDIREAVAHGRLFTRALPATMAVLALEEFAEARDAGEWSGLVDYVREVDE